MTSSSNGAAGHDVRSFTRTGGDATAAVATRASTEQGLLKPLIAAGIQQTWVVQLLSVVSALSSAVDVSWRVATRRSLSISSFSSRSQAFASNHHDVVPTRLTAVQFNLKVL